MNDPYQPPWPNAPHLRNPSWPPPRPSQTPSSVDGDYFYHERLVDEAKSYLLEKAKELDDDAWMYEKVFKN